MITRFTNFSTWLLSLSCSLTLCAYEKEGTQKAEQISAKVEKPAENHDAESKPADAKPVVQGHVFAWPFLETEAMQPRGGTSRGTEVTLMKGQKPSWEKLQAEGVSQKEKDRLAILAMAGSYRVSFDFVEIAGFQADYTPPKPYFSWGTELVVVLEDSEDFISLQHALVMYFKDKEGKQIGPHVMKHWRQDWRYEDTEAHVYRGATTWEREQLESRERTWTQAVYQVDDSPRYEVQGRWEHSGGVSSWKSEPMWRPLPRREFSVRDDYQVLQGRHEITITPNGWVHTQQNDKLALSNDEPTGTKSMKSVGKEYGINRYEEITSPDLAAGAESLEKTAPYWAAVRAKWAEVQASSETFHLQEKVDGKKLWQHHFGYAAKVSKDGWNEQEGIKHARETIDAFLKEVSEGVE